MPESPSSSSAPAAAERSAVKAFGRFELRALLAKTERSMVWLAADPRIGRELILCMPRVAPNSEAAMAHWMSMANAGARIEHPKLAPVMEVGRVEQWPFIAYERSLGETLDERLRRTAAPTPLEAAEWMSQFLEGLAFAHEAGHAHRDIQPAHFLIDAQHKVRLIGLEVAQEVFPANVDFNTVTRRAVRESAEEDILCAGLLLHRILSGKRPLDQADLHAVVQQMQPLGKEVIRLGWETPHPIPDPLRAICNRATDRQARQRYLLARTFLRALEGWRLVAQQDEGGAIQLLLDKMQRNGHLPSTSGSLRRALGGNSGFDAQHTNVLSELVLKDMALTLELLRRVNNALRQQGHQGEAILNIQRALQMIGLDGLHAAVSTLKPWPGVLQPQAAERLKAVMQRVAKAGEVAQALRPAGYDSEVTFLIVILQNLGRLLLAYHLPDDALQMQHLMQVPEPTEDQPQPVGMSEQAAAYAVLGCDMDTLGTALTKYWHLGDDVMRMSRRLPVDAPVHKAMDDVELLRQTASLANELVDCFGLPETRRRAALDVVTRRYAKPLSIGAKDVQEALFGSPEKARERAAERPAPPDLEGESSHLREGAASAAAPSLRSRLTARATK
ncbi:HDOD domain-containing protein [Roseateles paludis]|uniref:HDOD domain-containing protein n=1 Tax=Roseateles paludis TaxID=3145238 RepID=A0ABV0G2Y5_9BURK